MTNFAMISGNDQWLRVAHQNTNLMTDTGVVQLAWKQPEVQLGDGQRKSEHISPALKNIAFDPACRVYHSNTNTNAIESLGWKARRNPKDASNVFDETPHVVGDFNQPRGKPFVAMPGPLAIDADGIMYIADVSHQKILLFDILNQKIRRTVSLKGMPLALCECRGEVFVVQMSELGEYSVVKFTLTTPTLLVQLPETLRSTATNKFVTTMALGAISVDEAQQVYLLTDRSTEVAQIHASQGRIAPILVPHASDVLFDDENKLIVAREPGAEFLRFSIQDQQLAQLSNMQASYYDGRGISLDPKGRVAYWAVKKDKPLGVLNASVSEMRFQTQGRVFCYRLDNGLVNQAWGKVFIDACIPKGTTVKLGYVTSDEPDTYPSVASSPPENVKVFSLQRPDLTPALPSELAINNLKVDQLLHQRSQERELPWSFADDPWRTLEAPVNAPAGRYLWVVIDLFGTSHFSPKIKHLRVEYTAGMLLSKLPAMYANQGASSQFLQRYLAMLETDFMELGERANTRNVLLDPQAVPTAMLAWIADLLGMPIDERWSLAAKRDILQNAMWLFKYKGTIAGIKRFIDIYLENAVNVQIVEHYQTRGLGGAFVGESEALEANSVLGAGYRIGGRIGDADAAILNVDAAGSASAEDNESNGFIDAIRDNAHRFSVIVPLQLSSEQAEVIDLILELHRPAHTIVQVCSVDAGMRVGLGLHLGLTSVVGKPSGFGSLRLGDSIVGGNDLLGQAPTGMSVGRAKTGINARVG